MCVEPELRQSPPRPVSLTGASRARLVFEVAGPLAVLAAVARVFFSGPQPHWVGVAFVACVVLGAALAYRFALSWIDRVRLAREGTPLVSVIVLKQPRRGDRARYLAWYEAEGRQRGIEWDGPVTAWEVGDAVTVLADPANPEKRLLYALAGCAARTTSGEVPAPDAVPSSTASQGAGD